MDGNAIIYCQGAFLTPNGKTAHGLIRHTDRYRVVSVIDSDCAGKDAGELLDGKYRNIPVLDTVDAGLRHAESVKLKPDYLVIGLAPDGGMVGPEVIDDIQHAISSGLNIDSGLHDFLSEHPDLSENARIKGVHIRDIRKPPPTSALHFFSGKIREVNCIKIAILGTDSAIGKRTTALFLSKRLREKGFKAEMIGTGQTSWLQGVKYSIVLDSLINDFVAGEIEHVVHTAWKNENPDLIILEGQGSLLNPAYPGGFELIAAGRPDYIILQHAPKRKEYDGFPGYAIQPLDYQVKAVEMIAGKPVIAITINHEKMTREELNKIKEEIFKDIGLTAFDILWDGTEELINFIVNRIYNKTV
ncbi:MAG: hypothetical protein AMS27_10570 [Bacteroides sp. SM23_62_1]|nr:MAG: hypothetical protein AMS27_10570 [Bacteroides sp. SM23_62_1]